MDVSANTALTTLSCSYNPFTSFDVSTNAALVTLSCFHNELTDLDVSTFVNNEAECVAILTVNRISENRI